MNLKLILATSLIAAFAAWYLCSLIPGRTARGILRATFIALLCSPGIIVGHGFAVVPSLFALYVQPSIFTIGPMLVVLAIALGVIFGVPALRNNSRRKNDLSNLHEQEPRGKGHFIDRLPRLIQIIPTKYKRSIVLATDLC